MEARSAASLADATVAVTRLDAAPEAVDAAARVLSVEERRRADRFIHLRDRRRFIMARAWLRRLLAAELDTEAEALDFVYGDYGKPALSPAFAGSDLCFNLSHAGDMAGCALTHGHEVGIDIEAVRSLRDADTIAAQFFSARENRAWRALAESDRPLGFFNCWTRKEAFVKALGEGLAYPLDGFEVSLAPNEPARLLRVGDVPGRSSGWQLHAFVPAPGFVGAIVVRGKVSTRHRRQTRTQPRIQCSA